MAKALQAWEEELANAAKDEYDSEKAGGGGTPTISIKNSEFSLGGNDLGETLEVVIVAHNIEHAYYDSPYNADEPQPPACFALSPDEEDMVPHEDSPDPQDEYCDQCWADEWGSSPTGKGKACKNSRRLAVVAVDDEGVQTGEMPTLRVPPTSIGNFANYVKRTAKTLARPTWAIVTEVSFDDSSDWEKLKFSVVRKLDQEEVAAIREIQGDADDLIAMPFDVSNYVNPEELKKQRRKPTTKKKAAPTKKKAAPRSRARSKMS